MTFAFMGWVMLSGFLYGILGGPIPPIELGPPIPPEWWDPDQECEP